MDKLEEISAIRSCQAGDKDAFRVLAEAYEKMLFGVAYLMTHDSDVAEDAVQEAFLKMWKHLPALRGENGLKPWLLRILVNEVRQQGRKKTQSPTVPVEQAPEIADCDERVEEIVEHNELREAVRKAVTRLPDDQREAVILRYFGCLTVEEVAIATGCPKGTAKSRLSRALDRLGVILKASGAMEVMD